ncbi:hypothetical protein U879_10840 [Defluviimonas sp. 20V17]|nr:hypothetical protein U879_10840 [Defluviimonas sp. 20V17]
MKRAREFEEEVFEYFVHNPGALELGSDVEVVRNRVSRFIPVDFLIMRNGQARSRAAHVPRHC